MNPSNRLSRLFIVASLILVFVLGFTLICFDPLVSSKSPQDQEKPSPTISPEKTKQSNLPAQQADNPAQKALAFDLLKRLPAEESELPASRYHSARAQSCRMQQYTTVNGQLLSPGKTEAGKWTSLGPVNQSQSIVDPCVNGKGSDSGIPFDQKPGAIQFRYGAIYPNGRTILGGSGLEGVWRGERSHWTNILDGIGGFVAINRDDSQIIYAAGQGLALKKSDDGGKNFVAAINGINDSGLLLTPFAMDPNDPQRMWTGGRELWRTTDGATQWTQASAGIAGSKDARISAIAIAPADFNRGLAGTSEGHIHRTNAALSSDAQTDWPVAQPRRGFVSSITFDPRSADIVYATYSPRVFRLLAAARQNSMSRPIPRITHAALD